MAVDLDLTAAITTPLGWLALEDEQNGYELQADSFAEEATSWRKREITAEWVEGSFTVAAVRNNIVVPLSVWITGDTPLECTARRRALEDAFAQLRFTLRVRWGDVVELMNCQTAPYSKTSSGPLMMSVQVLMTAQVPTLPTRVVQSAFTMVDPFTASGAALPWLPGTGATAQLESA